MLVSNQPMLQHLSSLCCGVHEDTFHRDITLAGDYSGTKKKTCLFSDGKSKNMVATFHAGEVIHKPGTTGTGNSLSYRERKSVKEPLVSCCWRDN